MIRVVLTGSESTGKTTLAGMLGEHFGAVVIPEFSRAYAESRNGVLTAGDVDPIASGQLALEDVHLIRATGLAIHDTDLLSTMVYARHYYEACAPWIEDAVRRRRPDLYLLMDIDVPWIPDPARDRGDRREEMHALFVAALESVGAEYVTIRGDWDERTLRAKEAIDEIQRARRRAQHS